MNKYDKEDYNKHLSISGFLKGCLANIITIIGVLAILIACYGIYYIIKAIFFEN